MRIRRGQRLLWLSVIFLLAISALGGRLYVLQVTHHEERSREADSQRALKLPIYSTRGWIFDRQGRPLTDPRDEWGVAVFPPLVKDPEAEAMAVAAVLGTPDESTVRGLVRRMKATGQASWLADSIDQQKAEAVRRMGLPGIVAAPFANRYGHDSVATHLVGFVTHQGDQTVGSMGLEAMYNKELSGQAVPHLALYRDARGNPLNGLGIRTVVKEDGKPPYNLFTTIDLDVQKAVERTIDDWIQAEMARRNRAGSPAIVPPEAGVVVMDPRTGEVLAMASRPNYDQKTYMGAYDHFLLNWTVREFEPGSAFKPLIAALALELGKVSPDEAFTCPGYYQVGGTKFADFEGHAHGRLTFAEAVAKSCNVVFAKVGYERLGATGLRQVGELFELGRTTGRVPGEESGRLPNLTYGGDVAQASFGQGGLMVTPLQMARAYSAIVNDGMLPEVRLVDAIKDPAGKVIDRMPAGESKRVFSAETAERLRRMLAGVTAPQGAGTGKKAWVPGPGAAGKTGSAEAGGETTHAWFAGYVPLGAPKYVIVALVPNGDNRNLGSEVAAPLFRAVGEAVLKATGGY